VASALYQFVWDEYCDWYLEIAKIQLERGDESQQRATRRTLIRTLEKALRLAHPIIPFITEELWQKIAPIAGISGDSIMTSAYPTSGNKTLDGEADQSLTRLKEIVTGARSLKSEAGIGPHERWPLYVSGDRRFIENLQNEIMALTKSSQVIASGDTLPDHENYPSTTLSEFSVMLKVEIDKDVELEKLQAEKRKLSLEIEKESTKLSNPNYVAKAPGKVVQQTRERISSNQEKLERLKIRLDQLKN
jgi:valyl-tRNA synthetase